jgi:hypothetical protein
MPNARLELPKDPNSELFFDPRTLSVGYRVRKSDEPSRDLRRKVLRVVIQAFGRVVDDRFFSAGTRITFGETRSNTFQVPTRDLPEKHVLVEYNLDGTVTLNLNKHFGGILQVANKLQPLADVSSTASGPLKVYHLPKGSRGCLEHGTLLIYFDEIPDPDRVPPVAIWRNLSDPYFVRWLAASLALHFLFLLIMLLVPIQTAEMTLKTLSPKFQKILIEPKEIKPYVPLRAMAPAGVSHGKQGMEGEGARAPGKEGRRGRGVPGAGAMTQKDLGRTGVLDFFTKAGRHNAFAELLAGGSAIPKSAETKINNDARFGLQGERDLKAGKGLQGAGTGGGGLSTSIGQGLGTKGHGGGAKGSGLADFGTGKSDVAVSASVDAEEVYIMGSIPRDVIAKIMNDHMGQFRWCYEKELTQQPDLRGKISTAFVIGLEGRVTSASIKQTTMRSQNVEGCILNVIRRLPFPKPGGGVVEVIYPFLFHVAG